MLHCCLSFYLQRSRLAEEVSRRENAEVESNKMKESLSHKEDQYKQSVITSFVVISGMTV